MFQSNYLGTQSFCLYPLSAYGYMNNPVLRSVMENQSIPAVLWEQKHKECKTNNAVTNLT